MSQKSVDEIVEELEASVKEHGEIDRNAYDLVIDTDKTNSETTVKLILDLVIQHSKISS